MKTIITLTRAEIQSAVAMADRPETQEIRNMLGLNKQATGVSAMKLLLSMWVETTIEEKDLREVGIPMSYRISIKGDKVFIEADVDLEEMHKNQLVMVQKFLTNPKRVLGKVLKSMGGRRRIASEISIFQNRINKGLDRVVGYLNKN